MKNITLKPAVRAVALLLLASPLSALAQDQSPLHLTSLISDYPSLSASVKASPWEMQGLWSMDLHPTWGTADLSEGIRASAYGQTDASPDTNRISSKNAMINPSAPNSNQKNAIAPPTCKHSLTTSSASTSLTLSYSMLPGITTSGNAGNDDPVGCCCLEGGGGCLKTLKTQKECDGIAKDAGVGHTWKEGKCE